MRQAAGAAFRCKIGAGPARNLQPSLGLRLLSKGMVHAVQATGGTGSSASPYSCL